MKKLSMLIAMILCVTIGGVYAAWTYTNPQADITDKGLDTVIGVVLPSAEQSGAIGDFNVSTNLISMSIDQYGKNEAGIDFHKAVLNYNTSDGQAPYIEFTLTLVENADEEFLKTFQATYSIDIEDVASVDGTYKGTKIFTDLKPGATAIGHSTSDEDFRWVYDSERGLYACRVDVTKEFSLGDIILPSKSEHTAFSLALGTPTLKVLISDGITAT